MAGPPDNITGLIQAYSRGDKASFDLVVKRLEPELRIIARSHLSRIGRNATLSTTAVVNEAYIKLVEPSAKTPDSRSHFLAIAAKTMRNVLVDYARKRNADKRGGGQVPVDLDRAEIALDDQAAFLTTLEQALNDLQDADPLLVRVFECRFFAGLTDQQTAESLDLSLRTSQRQWMKAKAFLGSYFE